MRLARVLPLAAALLVSHHASAYTVDVLSPGTILPGVGYQVETFDNLTAENYGSTAAFGTFSFGGVAIFSGQGIVMNNNNQGSDGLYAQPFGDPTNYMAVLGGDSETITYAHWNTSFGLYWGSVDSYNTLTFYNGKTLVATVGGSDVAPALSADGGQGNFASNGYVLLTGLPSFNSVVVGSGSNSFEFDNVTAAAPEPSTWAMFGIGFVGLASLAARRGRKNRLAPAFS